MRIVVFGASGRLGQRVVAEAKGRGHQVTSTARRAQSLDIEGDQVAVTPANVNSVDSVAEVAVGHDVAISTIGPAQGDPPDVISSAAQTLLSGLSVAGVRRLVVSGGAGSLEVAPGVRLVDTPDFPERARPVALAHAAALDVYMRADTDVDWSYISPAAVLEPGERTGRYRVGGDALLTDADGKSYISMEDFAVAIVDEAERPKHIRKRFTVAF